MIDEKKIKRELQSLLEKADRNSPEEKILKGFKEYINRQRVISAREMRLANRIGLVMRVARMNVNVEVE